MPVLCYPGNLILVNFLLAHVGATHESQTCTGTPAENKWNSLSKLTAICRICPGSFIQNPGPYLYHFVFLLNFDFIQRSCKILQAPPKSSTILISLHLEVAGGAMAPKGSESKAARVPRPWPPKVPMGGCEEARLRHGNGKQPFFLWGGFSPWKVHGKSMENPWKVHGKSMESPWKVHGKSMESIDISQHDYTIYKCDELASSLVQGYPAADRGGR